ncbi:class I SAM-dependent RNA methyltransferase [Microbacterium hominis]|uniref:Class I SAM-dependent RNA methyltransferase n=1 Tax=Microbacterium hominis TaxID=162426 RepID=A0A7D4U5C0_9MICO|nr:class I SAM-dependent RNA methyltransferase [Microbacterium hominis]QKJ20045.1 class I SAM-dependent RNA methyltransferase [Microbacterium hominis]
MDSGDLIDLDITDVAHGGVFVGRHEGRVVFAPDTLPGERVRVRLSAPEAAGQKRFLRAETLEVVDAAPGRRPHVWRQADIDAAPEQRPGGADFGHIALETQRELKHKVLRDALERIGRLEVSSSVEAPASADADGRPRAESPDGTGWRTRLSLHVDDDGRVGPFAARSHRVIEVEDHPLATAAVERAALRLGGTAPGRVDLVEPGDGRVRVLPRPTEQRRGRRGPASRPAKNDPAREVVTETVGGRAFRVDAGGFWQVHRLAASTLARVVTEQLQAFGDGGAVVDPDAWHLDLYGGVGLFAAVLGDLGGPSTRVTSVESDPRATEHAGENLSEWVGARAETARVDRWIGQLANTASAGERERLSRGVVLLDPPRSGAGREVVEQVAGLNPGAVVYVACDPVALARDLATFRTRGYETAHVRALDLFPNSHHLEAVAVLTADGRG